MRKEAKYTKERRMTDTDSPPSATKHPQPQTSKPPHTSRHTLSLALSLSIHTQTSSNLSPPMPPRYNNLLHPTSSSPRARSTSFPRRPRGRWPSCRPPRTSPWTAAWPSTYPEGWTPDAPRSSRGGWTLAGQPTPAEASPGFPLRSMAAAPWTPAAPCPSWTSGTGAGRGRSRCRGGGGSGATRRLEHRACGYQTAA